MFTVSPGPCCSSWICAWFAAAFSSFLLSARASAAVISFRPLLNWFVVEREVWVWVWYETRGSAVHGAQG
jgi:hypothetical protein